MGIETLMLSFLSTVVKGLCGFWGTPPVSDVNGQWAQFAGESLPLGTQIPHCALETVSASNFLSFFPWSSVLSVQDSKLKVSYLVLLENVAIMHS